MSLHGLLTGQRARTHLVLTATVVLAAFLPEVMDQLVGGAPRKRSMTIVLREEGTVAAPGIEVRVGETVRFTIHNRTGRGHAIGIEGEPAGSHELLVLPFGGEAPGPYTIRADAGQAARFARHFPTPGTFRVICTIPGHGHTVATAKITVVEK